MIYCSIVQAPVVQRMGSAIHGINHIQQISGIKIEFSNE